jgi:hypothetical protein
MRETDGSNVSSFPDKRKILLTHPYRVHPIKIGAYLFLPKRDAGALGNIDRTNKTEHSIGPGQNNNITFYKAVGVTSAIHFFEALTDTGAAAVQDVSAS